MTVPTENDRAQSEKLARIVALAGIDDGFVRTSCASVAWFIDTLNHFVVHEPGAVIADIDAEHRSTIFPAPMSYTHQLIGHFLEGTRHGLLTISSIFSAADSVHIPVAVLSRQVVEYAASAYYLTNPGDAAEMRLAKMGSLYQSSLKRRTLPHLRVDAIYDQAAKDLNAWRSRASLPNPAPQFTTIEAAITRLLENFTDQKVSVGHYRRLSGLAHASPRDLTALLEPTWRDSVEMNAVHYAEAVGDIAVALRSVLAATACVVPLRSVPTHLEGELVQLRLRQFALIIEELTIRLSDFWATRVHHLVAEAYAAKGQQMPDLAEVFPGVGDDSEEPAP